MKFKIIINKLPTIRAVMNKDAELVQLLSSNQNTDINLQSIVISFL